MTNIINHYSLYHFTYLIKLKWYNVCVYQWKWVTAQGEGMERCMNGAMCQVPSIFLSYQHLGELIFTDS